MQQIPVIGTVRFPRHHRIAIKRRALQRARELGMSRPDWERMRIETGNALAADLHMAIVGRAL